jgi:hypothetical protein
VDVRLRSRTTGRAVYRTWKWGSRRVWLVNRGCLLLHGTWSHHLCIQRSVYAHSLICISYKTNEIDYWSLFLSFHWKNMGTWAFCEQFVLLSLHCSKEIFLQCFLSCFWLLKFPAKSVSANLRLERHVMRPTRRRNVKLEILKIDSFSIWMK